MQRGGSNRDFVCVSNPPVPSARNRRCCCSCPWTTGKLSKEQPPPLFTLWRRQSLRETAFQPIALLLLPPAAVVVVAGQPLCVPDDKELRATVVNTTGFLRISVETNKTKKCSRDACLGSFSNFRLRPPTSRESIAYYSNRMTPGDIHPDSICIDENCIYLFCIFSYFSASSFVVTVVFGTWQ